MGVCASGPLFGGRVSGVSEAFGAEGVSRLIAAAAPPSRALLEGEAAPAGCPHPSGLDFHGVADGLDPAEFLTAAAALGRLVVVEAFGARMLFRNLMEVAARLAAHLDRGSERPLSGCGFERAGGLLSLALCTATGASEAAAEALGLFREGALGEIRLERGGGALRLLCPDGADRADAAEEALLGAVSCAGALAPDGSLGWRRAMPGDCGSRAAALAAALLMRERPAATCAWCGRGYLDAGRAGGPCAFCSDSCRTTAFRASRGV